MNRSWESLGVTHGVCPSEFRELHNVNITGLVLQHQVFSLVILSSHMQILTPRIPFL